MKETRVFAGVIVAVFILLAVIEYTKQSSARQSWNNQKWGMVADAPKTVALKPGQWMRFGPVHSTVGSFRYDVNATLPLSTGLLQLDGAWPKTAACYEAQVYNTVKSCNVEIGSQQFIIVSDSRTAGDVVAGTLLRNTNAIADNKVTVTTYHWGCVADCVK